VPLALVDDDAPNRSRSFLNSSDKDGNDGFYFSGFKKMEERPLHGIDAGKETALDPRISEGVTEIANITSLINIHIQKMSAASQGKCCIRSLLLVDLQEPLQGEIGYHITVVAEYDLVIVQ